MVLKPVVIMHDVTKTDRSRNSSWKNQSLHCLVCSQERGSWVWERHAISAEIWLHL